jgi:hypothetical protein
VSEDRYLEYIWEKVALIHDVDDCRSKPYGEYYTLQRPLTAEAIKKARDIGPAEAGHTA